MASLPNLSHLRPTPISAKRAAPAESDEPDDGDNQLSRLPDAVTVKIIKMALEMIGGWSDPESMCVKIARLCATNKGICPEDLYHEALIALKMPPNTPLQPGVSWKESFTGVCREDDTLRAADGWMRRGILTASLEWEDKEFRLHTAVRRLEDYGPNAYPHLAWLMRARGGTRKLARKAVPDKLSKHDVSELTAENDYTHKTYGPIAQWDVADVTIMNTMFMEASSFNGDLSKWDVSNVTNMRYMFYNATSFNGDLSKWDVSRVTDTTCMFFGAERFNGDISNWDVSSVMSTRFMFYKATSFSGNLSQWEVSSGTDTTGMFWVTPRFDRAKHAPWYKNYDSP